MFCPSCGSENAQSQKFCRRCGTNLLALQAATEMVSEMAQGHAANQLDPKWVLKMVTVFGLVGFVIVTSGAIGLTVIQLASSPEAARNDPPFGLMLGFFGYTALTIILGMLLRWVKRTNERAPMAPLVNYVPPVNQISAVPAVGANTNPALNAAPAYQSIIEDETRQFVKQQKNN